MDYEKKNKDAISTIKQALRQLATNGVPVGNMIEAIKDIEEKYAESEDERIRKELLQIVKENEDSFYMVMTPNKREKLIAWLEKKPSLLTKEKALKNSPFVEQKPAWSEEDEDYRLNANVAFDDYFEKEYAGALRNWLKSLKDRVQPKQEWSEEDESYLNTTIAYLKDAKEFKKTAENCINWLKSLRPKNKWKPTEAQMDALDYYANNLCTYCDRQDDLRSLLNDLKQLKQL